MTMKVSKDQESPIESQACVRDMRGLGDAETKAARVFYVVATRATQRLVIGAVGMESLGGGWWNGFYRCRLSIPNIRAHGPLQAALSLAAALR